MNKLKQVINYGQKSYIPEGKKKNLKLHIRVPICLFIWKSNEKTNALFVNSAFFFFFFCLVQEVCLMDGGDLAEL